ncbi:hypothetical protein Godav_029621 [Gossypium davidsonii]|uniref:Uncharacterized protein n=2 Tax=Gossypium TaxID=3633 RepID=A0A7J8T9E3_GOSDV|nr:hypothetical protein [Gossypium davidsonii]MBA0663310.1 hypothetical protein [Gossypium klotzschianum]
MEDETQSLLPKNRSSNPSYSTPEGLELRSFRLGLNWFCLDQSNLWKVSLSWSFFFVLAIGVPIISHYVLLCSNCDEKHRRPYDAVVQLSLSSFAAVSFISLSSWARKYGIRKFLFLDKLCDVSDKVRKGYAEELQNLVVRHRSEPNSVPWQHVRERHHCVCVAVGVVALSNIHFHPGLHLLPTYLSSPNTPTRRLCSSFSKGNRSAFDIGRTPQDKKKSSDHKSPVPLIPFVVIGVGHCKSVLCFAHDNSNYYRFKYLRGWRTSGKPLCSISLVTGLFICLRSATKITHRAQAITGLAAKWHVCATINSFDEADGETPMAQIVSPQMYPVDVDWESDEEDEGDDLDNTKLVPIFAHTVSFQKRQALVTYLEHNRAGITVYGFMVDRTGIHTIFGIELALLLWLLNKTIGITYSPANLV